MIFLRLLRYRGRKPVVLLSREIRISQTIRDRCGDCGEIRPERSSARRSRRRLLSTLELRSVIALAQERLALPASVPAVDAGSWRRSFVGDIHAAAQMPLQVHRKRAVRRRLFLRRQIHSAAAVRDSLHLSAERDVLKKVLRATRSRLQELCSTPTQFRLRPRRILHRARPSFSKAWPLRRVMSSRQSRWGTCCSSKSLASPNSAMT